MDVVENLVVKRALKWMTWSVVLLVLATVAFLRFGLDWKNRPKCHKMIMLAFRTWQMDQNSDAASRTNAFPNVEGKGNESLKLIRPGIGPEPNWPSDYKYVPGLRENDPGDLMLMYLDRSTRWTWHGRPPSIFKDKAWIIVPVDFKLGERSAAGPGECSERVSLEEFQSRLRRTLDFIRTNERPHWQAIIAEHTAFLNSLERTPP